MWLVLVSLGGTFVWDRLCIYWFAPSVFQALKEEAAALSLVRATADAPHVPAAAPRALSRPAPVAAAPAPSRRTCCRLRRRWPRW